MLHAVMPLAFINIREIRPSQLSWQLRSTVVCSFSANVLLQGTSGIVITAHKGIKCSTRDIPCYLLAPFEQNYLYQGLLMQGSFGNVSHM